MKIHTSDFCPMVASSWRLLRLSRQLLSGPRRLRIKSMWGIPFIRSPAASQNREGDYGGRSIPAKSQAVHHPIRPLHPPSSSPSSLSFLLVFLHLMESSGGVSYCPANVPGLYGSSPHQPCSDTHLSHDITIK